MGVLMIPGKHAVEEGLFDDRGRLLPEMIRFTAWLGTTDSQEYLALAESMKRKNTTAIDTKVLAKGLNEWRRGGKS